jgi:hypothetical protein
MISSIADGSPGHSGSVWSGSILAAIATKIYRLPQRMLPWSLMIPLENS